MEISGIEIPVLVIGIVQVVKQLFPQLTVNGKLAVALIVGIPLLSLAQALPFMSDGAAQVVVTVVRVIGYAVAIPGWFGVMKDEVISRLAQRTA